MVMMKVLANVVGKKVMMKVVVIVIEVVVTDASRERI